MKTKRTLDQTGSHKLLIIIVVAVIVAIGVAAFLVFGPKNSKYGYVWDFNGTSWHSVASAPECPAQVLAESPTDTSKATTILWPGQYRGTNYKPHGAFRFDDNKTGEVTVKLPFDAHLVGATKYQQTGNSGAVETQYLMTFENACGYAVMFDHLYELNPEFTAAAEHGASNEVNNTEGKFLSNDDKKFYKAGTVVATKVGFIKEGNTTFDFGVYDLRKPNEMSKNAEWANLHNVFASQAFYGVCWIDLLPSADKARVMSILPTATDDRGASDFCSFAPGGSTLKYNNGKPVNASTTNTNTQNTSNKPVTNNPQ
jgi:hypothetical protein